MKILPIASGSTGNSMLLDLGGKTILIDLGISASMLKAVLAANGYTFDGIDAVLITHTHSDHVKGLEVCLKRIKAPVFMSHTSKEVLMLERAEALTYSARTEILPGLWVTAIRTSHDCPGSVGFKIETEDLRFGYLTDLGCIPESTMEMLYGSECIVIESNHDEEMLRYGRFRMKHAPGRSHDLRTEVQSAFSLHISAGKTTARSWRWQARSGQLPGWMLRSMFFPFTEKKPWRSHPAYHSAHVRI